MTDHMADQCTVSETHWITTTQWVSWRTCMGPDRVSPLRLVSTILPWKLAAAKIGEAGNCHPASPRLLAYVAAEMTRIQWRRCDTGLTNQYIVLALSADIAMYILLKTINIPIDLTERSVQGQQSKPSLGVMGPAISIHNAVL